MTSDEFLEALACSQQQLRRQAGLYLVKMTVSLGVFIIIGAVLFDEPEVINLKRRIIASIFLVGLIAVLLLIALQTDRSMIIVTLKCQHCGKKWYPSDIKIVTASRHCPYCGKEAVEIAQQTPSYKGEQG